MDNQNLSPTHEGDEANENESKGVLTYGSTIYLSFIESNKQEYFAYSEGLTRNHVELKSSQALEKESLHVGGLFMVYPAFYNQEYEKGKEKFEKIREGFDELEFSKRENRSLIPKLVKNINEEIRTNYDLFEKIKGTPVKYGSSVQLLHVSSQKYLAFDPQKPSELDNESIQVALHYENNDYTCFKIMPSYRYQAGQHSIFDEDVVLFQPAHDLGGRMLGEQFLHASKTVGNYESSVGQIEKKEINIASEKKTQWKINIFCEFNEKTDLLNVGDMIWINLSENDKNLIAHSYSEKDDINFHFISMPAMNKFQQFIGNSNGMFIIENRNMKKGGYVQWNHPYYLKHLTTKKYISLGNFPSPDVDETISRPLESLKLVSSRQDASLIRFKIVASTINTKFKQLFVKNVPRDAYVRIELNNEKWLTYRDIYSEHLDILEAEETDFFTLPLVSHVEENSIFHLNRANPNEMIVTNFLLSCKSTIKSSLQYLDPAFMRYRQSEPEEIAIKFKVFKYKIEQMQDCLKKLDLFCRNKLPSYLGIDERYGHVNHFIQSVLKEQSFIEILIQILVTSFPTLRDLEDLIITEHDRMDKRDSKNDFSNTFSKNVISPKGKEEVMRMSKGSTEPKMNIDNLNNVKLEVNHRKSKIVKLTYRLIISICEENVPNKNYVFRYSPIFQLQSYFFTLAIDCVVMILKDNEQLLFNLYKTQKQEEQFIESGPGDRKKTLRVDSKQELGTIRRKSPASSLVEQTPTSFLRKDKNLKRTMLDGANFNSAFDAYNANINYDDKIKLFQQYYDQVYLLFVQSKFEIEFQKIFDDWNYIQYFASLLKSVNDLETYQKLLNFFKTISVHEGQGISVNQELIYKYFSMQDSNTSQTILNKYLMKLFTENETTLKLNVPLSQYKDDVYELQKIIESDEGAQNRSLSILESFDSSQSEFLFELNFENKNQQLVINFIDFCASMCRNRNFSWKRYFEGDIRWTAMLYSLDQKLPPPVKASLVRFLATLFIDQEPRREITIPVLSKIVDVQKLEKQEDNKVVRLETMAVNLETEGNVDTINIEDFKKQFLNDISQLGSFLDKLPATSKIIDNNTQGYQQNYNQIFNDYICEILETMGMLLKFKKIKINTKKLKVEPFPKENELMQGFKKKAKVCKFITSCCRKTGMNKFSLKKLNPFKSKKTDIELNEFEKVLRNLIRLVEYDSTYPEVQKALIEVRRVKQEKLKQKEELFSGKKLVKGIFSGAKGLFTSVTTLGMFGSSSQEAKKSKKKAINFDFLDSEHVEQTTYLKQGEIMKKLLENINQGSEHSIETTIKNKVLDIIDYFFDYKQDKLLANARRVFYLLIRQTGAFDHYQKNPDDWPGLRKMIQKGLKHYLKYFLPKIPDTGCSVDIQVLEEVQNEDEDEINTLKQNIDDILDINQVLGKDFLPVLIQNLCINNQKEYEKRILKTILRMYNQRQEFVNTIRDLQLLFDDKNIENYNRSNKLLLKLQKYQEEAENWLTTRRVDEQILLETKQIILFFYNSLLSAQVGDEEKDFEPYRYQREDLNNTRQIMYRHLKIFSPIIQLIKDAIHIVKENQQPETLELFRLCYSFLAAFVKDNVTNQNLLSNSLVVFTYQMERSDLGQIEVVNEIFRDNENICRKKPDEIKKFIVNAMKEYGRKAKYLEFFRIIQECKGDIIHENQQKVLDILLDPANRQQLLYQAKQEPNKPQGFSFQQNKAFGLNDEPFEYHAKLFEVLGLTASGKEGLIVNEVRLRNALDFGVLLEFLLKDDNYSYVNDTVEETAEIETERKPPQTLMTEEQEEQEALKKRELKEKQIQARDQGNPNFNTRKQTDWEKIKLPVAKYLYYVYVESDKTPEDELSKVKSIIEDLVVLEDKRIQTMSCCKDEYITYLFDYLIKVIFWYYKYFVPSVFHQDKQSTKSGSQTEIVSFAHNIIQYEHKFDPKKVSEEGKRALHDLLSNLNCDQPLEGLDGVVNENPTQFFRKRTGQSKVFETVILAGEDTSIKLTQEKLLKKLWDEFMVIFLESSTVEMEMELEKSQLAKAIIKSDELVGKEKVLKEIISKEDVIKKFISFIIDNENTYENKETFILILGTLKQIIKNEKEEESQIEMQNFLNNNNAVYMLMSKLCDLNLSCNDEFFRALIDFGITLLEGGNREVQKKIYNYCINFNNSEAFFFKLHDLFGSEIQNMKRVLEGNSGQLVDTSKDLEDVLRFLQLFAEGHFSDLQNYIRYQSNSYHSYDILSDISDLLDTYLQTKINNWFGTMLQCFDTLIEFIQGPCVDNQTATIQSSFLDLANALLSIDEREQQLINQYRQVESPPPDDDTSLKNWQIARLKYKCSITLLSLLEARKDDKNVYRIMKSIPIEVLKRNITDIYKMFMDQYSGVYNEEAFLHFNYDPDAIHSESYCNLIIETGFNLYFLLRICMETRNFQDENEETEILDEIEEKKDVIKNNIISQWGKLLISIFKSGAQAAKGAASKIKQQTDKLTRRQRSLKEDVKEETELINELQMERQLNWRKASEFFYHNTANIEVLREDSHLEKVYFYILPFCHAITKDTKNKFNKNAQRISAKAKVSYLLSESEEVMDTIKYEYKLQGIFNKLKILALLLKNIVLWRETAFWLSVTINILVLIGYEYPDEDSDEIKPTDEQLDLAILVLGIMLIVFSFIIVAYFLMKTAPLLIKKAWVGVSKDKLNIFSYVIRLIKTLFYLLSDMYVLYYFIYGFTAFIGVLVSPFFFAFHLFEVTIRYPVLQSVLNSVYRPIKSIAWTYLLFQFFNYFWSLLGYYWIHEDFNGVCQSTWQCYLTHFDKPFKSDGGIGGFMEDHDDVDIFRFAYDNLYNIFAMLFLLNIFAGIIIDTFAQLREDDKKYQFDVDNICFICGFDRETLDKVSDAKNGFYNHIKKEHYLWNYIFYIAYLKDKERTEYTGLESYIAEQIDSSDTSWMPNHRALVVGQHGNMDGTEIVEQMKVIEQKQHELLKFGNQLMKNASTLDESVKLYNKKKAYSKQSSRRSSSKLMGDANRLY